MAVPKRKTTPSKRGNRRSHDAISATVVSYCSKSGSFHRPHQMTSDGFYKGKKVVNNYKKETK